MPRQCGRFQFANIHPTHACLALRRQQRQCQDRRWCILNPCDTSLTAECFARPIRSFTTVVILNTYTPVALGFPSESVSYPRTTTDEAVEYTLWWLVIPQMMHRALKTVHDFFRTKRASANEKSISPIFYSSPGRNQLADFVTYSTLEQRDS